MDCIDHIADKYKLDKKIVASFADEINKQLDILRQRQRTANAEYLRLALEKVVDDTTGGEVHMAMAKARALKISYTKQMELVLLAKDSFRGHEWEALPAILAGSQRALKGARRSVDAEQVYLKYYYVGGLRKDLRALDNGGNKYLKMFRNRNFSLAIERALETIDNPNAPAYTGPRDAMKIAEVIHKWQERSRMDANTAGAWISGETGYITRQTHNSEAMDMAGEDQWVADIKPLLDLDRIRQEQTLQTDAEVDEFLREVFTNIVYARVKASRDPSLVTATRIGTEAARISHERILHFKNADAWHTYNAKYGYRDLATSIVMGLESMANSTGLMRRLGPNPKGTLEAVNQVLEISYRKAHNKKGLAKLRGQRLRVENILKEVDGTINSQAASHPSLARISRGVRALNNVTMLGGVLISSFNDVVTTAGEMHWQGHNFLGSILEAVVGKFHRYSESEKRVLELLGVYCDSLMGDVMARSSGAEGPGIFTKYQDIFFKMNGLTAWTNSGRRSIAITMAYDLAKDVTMGWEQLDIHRTRMFEMYDIGKQEWELIRQGKTMAADGRRYLVPDIVDTLSDAQIEKYLLATGVKRDAITTRRIMQVRDDLNSKIGTMIRDRINYGVLEPDARTRSIMHLGQSAGTVPGEILRAVGQFRSFTIAFVQRVFGREIYARSGESYASRASFAIQFLLASAVFGGLSNYCSDIIKGRTPRPVASWDTFKAALIRGGGLGILGDFMFGEYNRFGGGLPETLAGPTISRAGDIARIWAQIRDGKDARASTARLLAGFVPFGNLPYVSTAFNYLVMYNIYEMISPGYFNRMRRRIQRENNQDFYLAPNGLGNLPRLLR